MSTIFDNDDSSELGEFQTVLSSMDYYIPYTTSATSLGATTISTMSEVPTYTPTNPTRNTPIEQFRAFPGTIIIVVVVGVVMILLGVGLVVGEKRARLKPAESEEREISSVEKSVSYESGETETYILQRAQTHSMQFKRGVLVSVPCDRV